MGAAVSRDRLRWHLVHAAGCTVQDCTSVLARADLVYEARLRGVRIPKSLRRADAELSADDKAAIEAEMEAR